MILISDGASWTGVGWRPKGISPACKQMCVEDMIFY
jgi:hypothetical protein